MKEKDRVRVIKIAVWSLVLLDVLMWGIILFPAEARNLEFYFLDVGQGDSSLIKLPPAGSGRAGGVKILIDGGPANGRLEKNLENILPMYDRYIDLVVISHPQLDHFGGFLSMLKNYKVGAALMSHADRDAVSWEELKRIMEERKIRRIILNTGDRIRYGDSLITILSPNAGAAEKDINDLSLVTLIDSGGVKSIFAGDASSKLEKRLANLYNVDVDILKVSHHGSKFSSDPAFLKEASPVVSVIEVGKNSYGHPTKETLSRLANVSNNLYRTDKNGLLKIVVDGGQLKVYHRK